MILSPGYFSSLIDNISKQIKPFSEEHPSLICIGYVMLMLCIAFEGRKGLRVGNRDRCKDVDACVVVKTWL